MAKVRSVESVQFSRYVMCCVYVTSGLSLLIESTDSMICSWYIWPVDTKFNVYTFHRVYSTWKETNY